MYKEIERIQDLVLDDQDLQDIHSVATAKAAAHHISLNCYMGILHDLNVYGVAHGLQYGRLATARINDTKESI